jgi:hypothetical protein
MMSERISPPAEKPISNAISDTGRLVSFCLVESAMVICVSSFWIRPSRW